MCPGAYFVPVAFSAGRSSQAGEVASDFQSAKDNARQDSNEVSFSATHPPRRRRRRRHNDDNNDAAMSS